MFQHYQPSFKGTLLNHQRRNCTTSFSSLPVSFAVPSPCSWLLSVVVSEFRFAKLSPIGQQEGFARPQTFQVAQFMKMR
ncbi:hypothetical protein R1flu_014054 [Riccia fluitans]|uniref:Uncharacterized protein n=1 Tax=Riccia fluitans TaxID=41844 RepID=A0ABD1YF55_9MARC